MTAKPYTIQTRPAATTTAAKTSNRRQATPEQIAAGQARRAALRLLSEPIQTARDPETGSAFIEAR